MVIIINSEIPTCELCENMFAVTLPEFDLYRVVITACGCRYHTSCGHDKTSDGTAHAQGVSRLPYGAHRTILQDVRSSQEAVTLDPLEIRIATTEVL